MSNVSKSQWQSSVISDGTANSGIVSVSRLMELLGCGLQHTTNSVKVVLKRLSSKGILYADGGLTRKDTGTPFRYSVPNGKSRLTDADLDSMLEGMLTDDDDDDDAN